MSNHAYHNKVFGVAFIWIMVLTMLIPLVGTLLIDDNKLHEPIEANDG